MLATQSPFPQYFDTDGSPLDAGRLYFGTVNQNPEAAPITVYWDAAGTQPAAQPIRTLNGYAMRNGTPASVFVAGDYSVSVKTARGGLVVYAPDSSLYSQATALAALRAELNTAAGGDFALPLGGYFYIPGDGVADNSEDVDAANAAGKPVFVVGRLHIASAKTLTVPIVDTMAQIFTTGSQVTIDNGLPVRPEWFGSAAGNIRLAVNSLPAAGGTVKLEDKTYPPSYNTLTPTKILADTGVAGVDYLAKENISIIGSRLPAFNSGNTALTGGTIIQGPFYVFADGFRCDNFGVDSGADVVAALYAGAAQDGFDFCKPDHNPGGERVDVQIGRVVGLCDGTALAGHAILIEGINGGSVQYAEGRKALHGVVIKSQSMTCGTLIGRETSLESVICKSDDYAIMQDVDIAHVEASSLDATQDTGFGLLIDGVSAGGGKVQVGSVKVSKKANGVCVRSNGASMGDVQIGQVQADGCAIGVLLSGDIRRVAFGEVLVNNATYGVQVEVGVTHPSCSINALKVANATYGIYTAGKLAVGDMTTDTMATSAVHYYDTAARLLMGSHREFNVPTFWNLQPTLAGTWVNEGGAGNPAFRMTIDGGRVQMSGFIKSGGTSTVVNGFSVQVRPPENLTFVCAGFNGATLVPVTVNISTAGVVTIPNYASAPTYISLDGCEWLIPS